MGQLNVFTRTAHTDVRVETLDSICAELTAFPSFGDLLAAKGGYRPTMDCSQKKLVMLADCYDDVQAAAGDPRRAYRYRVCVFPT